MPLEGEEKRIFDAVVKPERQKANGDVERRARAAAEGDRPGRGDARQRALRRKGAGRGGRGGAREARALPSRARLPRRDRGRLTTGGFAAGGLDRVALAVARGVRARPHARAPRRSRRSAAGVRGRPRRRHERQVDDDPADRCAASRARVFASGRTPRRTSPAGTSGWTPTRPGSSARSRAFAPRPSRSGRRSSRR